MQGFDARASWNHWQSIDPDSHRLGPAVFGKLPLGKRRALRYNAAWLLATSSASPHQNLRMQLEYEF